MRALAQITAPPPRRLAKLGLFTGPREVEIEDLHLFTDCVITDHGQENLYFSYMGKDYFCKCF